MANEKEFQEQIRQLGKLVAQFDELPESSAKVAGKELVQLLMEVHGRGLERVMEVVFDTGGNSGDSGQQIIDKLGQDSVVGSLLLLYSLHPDGLEVRVQNGIDRMRGRLRKLSCAIELEGIHEGAVRVRLAVSSHACGSSTKDLRTIVEDGIYEAAPDLTSLEILGLEEQAPTGFVSIESLMGHQLVGAAATAQTVGESAL